MAKSRGARKKPARRVKDLGVENGLSRIRGGMVMKEAREDRKIQRMSKEIA